MLHDLFLFLYVISVYFCKANERTFFVVLLSYLEVLAVLVLCCGIKLGIPGLFMYIDFQSTTENQLLPFLSHSQAFLGIFYSLD